MKNTNLKPNGIARTVYPDQPCTDFNAWSAHITSKEIERDFTDFAFNFGHAYTCLNEDILDAATQGADTDTFRLLFKEYAERFEYMLQDMQKNIVRNF